MLLFKRIFAHPGNSVEPFSCWSRERESLKLYATKAKSKGTLHAVLWIYCGSGSGNYFGKILVPVPVPVPDPDLFSIFVQQQKIIQNLAFPVTEAAFFPIKLASNFDFVTFVLHLMLDPGPYPVPEPELESLTVAVALRQKVAVRFLS
jgi:hypothetical protein